jgi:hypothetical protein
MLKTEPAPSPGLAAFLAADSERSPGFAIFPLLPIVDGRCTCSRETCGAVGKHPAMAWGELGAGVQILPTGAQGAGIATGARSGGLVVLDIDAKGGVNGFASLETLEQSWGALPPTLTVRSPSGGLHLWFHHPGRFQSNQGVIGPGLDVRAEGGYAVLPGTIHKRGGMYQVEEAHPVAMLPPTWADRLPRAREGALRAAVTPVPVEATTLRQRLADVSKGRRGPAWTSLRAVVTGDRMFRIEGGGGPPSLEVVHGVDVYMSQKVLFTLCREPEWHKVPGDAIGALFASSLATLDLDAREAGSGSTKWTPEHVARTWDKAAEVVAGEVARADKFMSDMARAAEVGETARRTPTPLVIQHDNAYAVLDDSDPDRPRYTDFQGAGALYPLARQIWTGTRAEERPLEKSSDKGTRPMRADEIVEIYGRAVTRRSLDYTVRVPRVEGLTLIRGLEGRAPEPRHDPEAAAWLAALDPTGGLLDWLWWAKPERCGASAPALALIGASHVGKGALAEGVAVAAGMLRTVPLGKALQKHCTDLEAGPICFADEGLPREQGRLMTEEFRSLLTTTEHSVEVKGSNTRMIIRGAVRVILAANASDRLFNGGNLSSDDVAALARRLFVIDIRDADRAAHAKALIVGMGRFEMDPARRARVAGHVRWIQEHRADGAVAESRPRGGRHAPARRRAGDLAGAALDAISDAAAQGAAWVATDRARGALWVQTATLQRTLGLEGRAGATGPIFRAIRAYVRVDSVAYRAHPVTGATFPTRERWVGLSLDLLERDGITQPEAAQ